MYHCPLVSSNRLSSRKSKRRLIGEVGISKAGLGRHLATLHLENVILWAKIAFIHAYSYGFAVVFTKMPVLFFLLRIFVTKVYRWSIYIIMVIVALSVAYNSTYLLAVCHPIRFFWDKAISGGHCGNTSSAWVYISIPNLVTDVCMLGVPVAGVWRLQTSLLTKIGVMLTFLAGVM